MCQRDDTISRRATLDAFTDALNDVGALDAEDINTVLQMLPSAQPEIIRCKNCKHNPKESWFGCPMSHLSEEQRPETAWCWKGERRTE